MACRFGQRGLIFAAPNKGFPGRAVRHRSAKPATAVRIRWKPRSKQPSHLNDEAALFFGAPFFGFEPAAERVACALNRLLAPLSARIYRSIIHIEKSIWYENWCNKSSPLFI